jgi:hypothetical protein
MTQDTTEATARLDSITESDLARGFRIRGVPESVQEVLRGNGWLVPTRIKFLAMNPGRRAAINEAVNKRYYKDLQNPDIPSNAQIRRWVEERGEWTTVEQDRMEQLQESTQKEMLNLWRDGYSDDGSAWKKELLEQMTLITKELEDADLPAEEKEQFTKKFQRWVAWTKEQQVRYDIEYAAEQGLDAYRPDRDLNDLFSLAPNPTVADALNTVEELRDKQRRLVALLVDVAELNNLRIRNAKIFSGSAESRQSQAEELAQLYFACDVVDAEGKSLGKLATKFDEIFDWPHEALKWFIQEAYFFHNDIPEVAARQYLEAYGFQKAEGAKEPLRGEVGPSDASPAPPDFNNASAPATTTPLASSAPAMATSSPIAS